MAQKVDEAKYGAMIDALKAFASAVSSAVDEMDSIVNECVQNLSQEDEAVGQISSRIKGCEKKYLECCKQALTIAQEMQQELEAQQKEREIWSEDD